MAAPPGTRPLAPGTMPAHGAGARAAAWVRRWWRACLAELLATALLLWLGVAAAVPVAGPGSTPVLHSAFAFGGVVAGLAMAFGPTSGAHMNPSVTLAALLQGRIAPAAAVAYLVAQLAGALLGFGALLAVSPAAALPAPVGCTLVAAGVAPGAALALEAGLTGLLALACCAAWAAHDHARPDHAEPLKLGLLIAGLIFAGGPATGASLNPARSLAPAALHGVWTHHWVYWAGPLGGAALAALLHRFLLAPRAPARPAPAPEAVPLRDHP